MYFHELDETRYNSYLGKLNQISNERFGEVVLSRLRDNSWEKYTNPSINIYLLQDFRISNSKFSGTRKTGK